MVICICECSEYSKWNCYKQYQVSFSNYENIKAKFSILLEEKYYISKIDAINDTFIDFINLCFSYLNKVRLLDYKTYPLLTDIMVNILPEVKYISPKLQLEPHYDKSIYNIGLVISNSRVLNIYNQHIEVFYL